MNFKHFIKPVAAFALICGAPLLQAPDAGRIDGGQYVGIHHYLCSPGAAAPAGFASLSRSSCGNSAAGACWLSCSARM